MARSLSPDERSVPRRAEPRRPIASPLWFGARARLALVAIAGSALLCVPVISDDVWAYAAYGALLAHGADPWAHALHGADVAPFRDGLLDAALRAWDGSLPRDVYGPLFTLPVAAFVAALRPLGPNATMLALRALAVAALVACVAIAGRVAPRLAPWLALHPVVLWSAAEGHNDVYWVALVLAASGMRRMPARLAGLTAAAALKAFAVVPLVSELVRGRASPRVVAAVAGVLGLAYAPLVWSLLAHGLDRGAGPPRISLLHAGALAAWSASPVPVALAIGLGVAAVAALARLLRGGELRGAAALAGWLVLPAPEPWYAVWLLPLAAWTGSGAARRALIAASFSGAAVYLQDLAPGTALAHPALLGGTMVALYALPLLVALFAPAPSPQPQAPPAPIGSPSPAPSPASTTTPTPPSPEPTATPTANPFTYIVTPTPGPSGAPQIREIAVNDRVLHKGGMLLVRVMTSPDVTTVLARTWGRAIFIPQGAPGYFAGQEQLPSGIPSFLLNRTYEIEVVASTADGRSASYKLPLRLER